MRLAFLPLLVLANLAAGCASLPNWAQGPSAEVSELGHCYRGQASARASEDDAQRWAERRAMDLLIADTASAAASSMAFRREDNGTVLLWAGREGDGPSYVLRQEGSYVDESPKASGYSDLSFSLYDAAVRVCADPGVIEQMRQSFGGRAVSMDGGRAEALIVEGDKALGRVDLVAAYSAFARALASLPEDPSELRARAEQGLARIAEGLVIGFAQAPEELAPGEGLAVEFSFAASFEGKPIENTRFTCEVAGAQCKVEGGTDATGIAAARLSGLMTAGKGAVEVKLQLSREMHRTLTVAVTPVANSVLVCGDEASNQLVSALEARLQKKRKTVMGHEPCTQSEPGFFAEVFVRLKGAEPVCTKKGKQTTCAIEVIAEVRSKTRGFGKGARVRKSAKKKSEAAALQSASKKLRKTVLQKVSAMVESAAQ